MVHIVPFIIRHDNITAPYILLLDLYLGLLHGTVTVYNIYCKLLFIITTINILHKCIFYVINGIHTIFLYSHQPFQHYQIIFYFAEIMEQYHLAGQNIVVSGAQVVMHSLPEQTLQSQAGQVCCHCEEYSLIFIVKIS